MFWKTPNPLLPKTAPPPFDTIIQLHNQQRHIKELQDLLQKEKDRSDLFRKQRDELQGRLDLLRDVLDGFDPTA
jgi:hypothetical protein